jgi:phosphoribosylaminoimidazole (AIR) synthetase
MRRTFNLGVGLVAIVPASRATDAEAACARLGLDAARIGTVVPA